MDESVQLVNYSQFCTKAGWKHLNVNMRGAMEGSVLDLQIYIGSAICMVVRCAPFNITLSYIFDIIRNTYVFYSLSLKKNDGNLDNGK